ncbi:retrotransposon protein, putative, ty1-copia subclass [Tanacetum coccineum]
MIMAVNLINRLAHIGKTRMQKLQREGLLESINENSFDKCESCISGLGLVGRIGKRDSADKSNRESVKCIFVGYLKETMGYYFYFPPENKVIVASEPEYVCGPPPDFNPVLVGLDPPTAMVVRSKWLYKKKMDMRCCILMIMRFGKWMLKTAFLMGRLDEDILLEQPDEGKAYLIALHYASAVGSIMYACKVHKDQMWRLLKNWFRDGAGNAIKDDTKSQTGYVFVVNGGAVDWKSKKQSTIAMHLRHNRVHHG